MIRAFLKLGIRDRIVLAIAVLAAVAISVAIAFNFLSGSYTYFSLFPDSVLLDRGDIQNYHHSSFRSLDKDIQFPGTKYGVSIGGDELAVTENGVSFKYSTMITLIAAMTTPDIPTDSFVVSNFPALIADGSTGTGDYSVKVYDTGYLNTLETEYQGGILKTSAGKHYVMTYRVQFDDVSYIIGASVDNKNYIKEAFYQLTHMFYTFCLYDNGLSSNPDGTSDGKPQVSVSADGVGYSAPTIEMIGDDEEERELGDVLADKREAEYKLGYPDASFIMDTVNITDELSSENVAFAFEYMFGTVTPKSAVLNSPDGRTYTPDYYNSGLDGRIVFIVDKPVAGEWSVEVSDDCEMGSYSTHALKYIDYMDAINSGERTEYDPDGVNKEYITVTGTDDAETSD